MRRKTNNISKLKIIKEIIKCIFTFTHLRLKIFYIKYLLGQCRRRCKNCLYKSDCYNNIE